MLHGESKAKVKLYENCSCGNGYGILNHKNGSIKCSKCGLLLIKGLTKEITTRRRNKDGTISSEVLCLKEGR